MTKLFLILFACLVSLGLAPMAHAQKISIESCTSIKLDEKYVLGDLFYGDADHMYYTANEVGKKEKYVSNSVSAILKYDKDMHLVASITMTELFGNTEEGFTFYSPKVVNGNFVFVTRSVIGKYNKSYSSKNKYIYASLVLDKEFKTIAPKKEFYSSQDNYRDDPYISYSVDSANILITFNRYESNTNLIKSDVEKTLIGMDKYGSKTFESKLTLPEKKEPNFTLIDVLFDNKDIYLVFKNIWTKKTYGISPKTGEHIKNGSLFKFHPATNTLDELAVESDLSNIFMVSSSLYYSNNTVYMIGTYYNTVNFIGASRGGFDGIYLIAVNQYDKVTQSNLNDVNVAGKSNQEKIYEGKIRNVFFKKDGSAYIVTENEYCYSYCNSDEIIVYSYDINGKLLWSKAIDKRHHGGALLNELNFMYSYVFTSGDNIYVLFNESKDNALSSADKPFSETKVWDKELYCLSYSISPDGTMTKRSLFNSDESGCKFFSNGNYNNIYQHKIYNLGTNKMLILNYD